MNGSHHNDVYLYAAYIVVWVVHSVYAFTLVSRGNRLKRDSQELNRR